MNIQFGVSSLDELKKLIKEDIDEFYTGLEIIPGHLYGGKNPKVIDEIFEMIKIVHSNNKKIFIVANEVREDLFDDTIKHLIMLIKNGIDGVIIRDIALLEELKKKKIKTYLILSSLALCFNKEALNFYKKLGINRIAIPEHITPYEALPLIKNNLNIDTEMFITAIEFCLVLNGFCYLGTLNGKCICRDRFIIDKNLFTFPRFSIKDHFSNLYKFYKQGCKIIKIGRGPKGSTMQLRYAFLIKKLLLSTLNEKVFVEKVIDIHTRFVKLIYEKQRKGSYN